MVGLLESDGVSSMSMCVLRTLVAGVPKHRQKDSISDCMVDDQAYIQCSTVCWIAKQDQRLVVWISVSLSTTAVLLATNSEHAVGDGRSFVWNEKDSNKVQALHRAAKPSM